VLAEQGSGWPLGSKAVTLSKMVDSPRVSPVRCVSAIAFNEECWVHREDFSAAEQAILAPYVSNLDQPVFALQHLPEEVIAVLFAYYSRSRESLRRNLLGLITAGDLDLLTPPPWQASGTPPALGHAQAKARQFHEKWVVGYGHASVAEHAVAHLAVEDVSMIASKVIESMRLASYTEKSTRYVAFDTQQYYPLPELQGTDAAATYHDTVQALFQTYNALLPALIEAVKRDWPRGSQQTERGYHTACRAKALDILRYLLPAGTLTNLGITINGRALEHLLTKMLSHPLCEVRQLGEQLKTEARKMIPTLLKYAEPNTYMAATESAMQTMAETLLGSAEETSDELAVRLVQTPDDAEATLAAAMLYSHTWQSWPQLMHRVHRFSQAQRQEVIDAYLSRRGPHDPPLRALEHLTYTFEILVDYGAYRDIQRHRMATQTQQMPSPRHGYSLPGEVSRYGVQETFKACMQRAATAYEQIGQVQPHAAPYVLPLAYRCRVLITWNLRELHHFVQLRSAKQGHVSYRHIAQDVYRAIEAHHPLLARYIRVDLEDYGLGRL
jgi:thymidylate synthase ThyX